MQAKEVVTSIKDARNKLARVEANLICEKVCYSF